MESEGIAVVGEANDGDEALRLVYELEPDVLVLEIDLPRVSSWRVLIELSKRPISTSALALSAYDDPRYVQYVMEDGLAGYLKKDESSDRIVQAVRGVARGEEGWLSPSIVRKMKEELQMRDATGCLVERGVTEREQEVLRLMAHGNSNEEIADHLCVSKHTVRTHVPRIYNKLGIRARRQAIAWAWEHRLVHA